jgi:hypothetical protein
VDFDGDKVRHPCRVVIHCGNRPGIDHPNPSTVDWGVLRWLSHI